MSQPNKNMEDLLYFKIYISVSDWSIITGQSSISFFFSVMQILIELIKTQHLKESIFEDKKICLKIPLH